MSGIQKRKTELQKCKLVSFLQLMQETFDSEEDLIRRLIAWEASYVDDVVQPVIAPAVEIIEKTEKTLAVWHAVFRRFGFELNYKHGKTNVVVQWAGKGEILARGIFEAGGNSTIKMEVPGGITEVEVVKDYKHLGQRWAAASHMGPEVNSKAAVINKTTRQYSRRLLGNAALTVAKRQQMSMQLCLSTGLWSAATWPALTTGQQRKIHHAVMKPLRIIHGRTWENQDENCSGEDLLAATGGMAPVVLLRLLQTVLFMRVCARAP